MHISDKDIANFSDKDITYISDKDNIIFPTL